ncbi:MULTISPECIES: IS66 family transposase [Gammaproteobacteria]|uniref:IS66 family transposase n=1 Tax=Gammaproteobacteria TaxID=1236 RepID=UPI00237AB1DC|nr:MULTISPECIES: transposase [Gammaproteobacteria]
MDVTDCWSGRNPIVLPTGHYWQLLAALYLSSPASIDPKRSLLAAIDLSHTKRQTSVTADDLAKASGLRKDSQFCETAAVVYDFSPSRAGEHARNFLQDWKGKLVCDDFGDYKASFELGVTEIGCMAHARRKFFELHSTNKSMLAKQALRYIQLLTKSKVRSATWSRIYDAEYGRKKPYR